MDNNSDWKIILYNPNGGEVVEYPIGNPVKSKVPLLMDQLVRPDDFPLAIPKATICPTCKRPWESSEHSQSIQSISRPIYPNYFRLLSNETNSSAEEDEREDQESQEGLPKHILNQGYYKKFFKEIQKLGQGGRGEHRLGSIVLGKYAVKKVPVGDSREWLEKMLAEVYTLELLRNPNIVEYKHTWLEYAGGSAFAPQVPHLHILMEYADFGNVEELVERHFTENGPLPEVIVKNIFKQTCLGLQYLHESGVVHRDLKPSNLLLTRNKHPGTCSAEYLVLLSDFGECQKMWLGAHEHRSGATGTIEFMAPELFIQDDREEYLYGHSVETDIWSLGLILYYICFGRLPYVSMDYDILRNDIITLTRIEVPCSPYSSKITELLQDILQLEPARRPTISTILNRLE